MEAGLLGIQQFLYVVWKSFVSKAWLQRANARRGIEAGRGCEIESLYDLFC